MRISRIQPELRFSLIAMTLALDVTMLGIWAFRPARIYSDWLGFMGRPEDSPIARLHLWAGGRVAPRTPSGCLSLFEPDELFVGGMLLVGLVVLCIVLAGLRPGSPLGSRLASPVEQLRGLSVRIRVRAALAAIAVLCVYLGWEIDAWRTWRLRAEHWKHASEARAGEDVARRQLAETQRLLETNASRRWDAAEMSQGYYRSMASFTAGMAVWAAQLKRTAAYQSELAAAYAERNRKYELAADHPWAAVEPDSPLPQSPIDVWVWRSRGDYAHALAAYDDLAREFPDYVEAHQDSAWIRAACPDARVRDGKRAVTSATLACELTEWKDVGALAVLAVAYAEVGDYAEAVRWQEKVLASSDEPTGRDHHRERLKLFKAGKPFRQK
jgi:tetratricopeptide (TPR) repeat protein